VRRGTRLHVAVVIVLVPMVTLNVCALSVESYCASVGNEHLGKTSALLSLLYCSVAFLEIFLF